MLILTRKIRESLMIGDKVTVTVLNVRGNQVRIGIDAPRDVSVYREEILSNGKGSNGKEAEDSMPASKGRRDRRGG